MLKKSKINTIITSLLVLEILKGQSGFIQEYTQLKNQSPDQKKTEFILSPYNSISSQKKINMVHSPDFGILSLNVNPPTKLHFKAEVPTYGISTFDWNHQKIALPYGTYTLIAKKEGYFSNKQIIRVERQTIKEIKVRLVKKPPLRFINKSHFDFLQGLWVTSSSLSMLKFISDVNVWKQQQYAILFSFVTGIPLGIWVLDLAKNKVDAIKSKKPDPKIYVVEEITNFKDNFGNDNVLISCFNETYWEPVQKEKLSGLKESKVLERSKKALNINIVHYNDSNIAEMLVFDMLGTQLFRFDVVRTRLPSINHNKEVNKVIKKDLPPRIKNQINPVYPVLALESSIEGVVTVTALINDKGQVAEAFVFDKHVNKILAKAALESVKESKYQPAITDGKPVEAWITIPITFKLR